MTEGAAHRIPQLDGVRGLAILLVVAGHTSETLVPYGGVVGVTAFFVLSGFVITRGLLAEHDATGHIRLRAFWRRRIVRLLPAYGIVLVVVTVLVVALSDPSAASYPRDLLAAATYTADYARALGDDLGVLGHTWSLAVEEQFYVLWPVAVVGILALSRRPVLALGGLGALVLATVLWRLAAIVSMPYDWLAYSLDTSAVGLLLGAAAAFVTRWTAPPRPRVSRLRRVAGAAAPGVLLVLAVCTVPVGWGPVPGATRWVSGAAVVVATVVVVLAANGRAPVLGLRWLRWFGTVSYGLYLWHFPLLGLRPAGHDVTGTARLAVVLLALGLATASWYVVERPLIRRCSRPRRLSVGPDR